MSDHNFLTRNFKGLNVSVVFQLTVSYLIVSNFDLLRPSKTNYELVMLKTYPKLSDFQR